MFRLFRPRLNGSFIIKRTFYEPERSGYPVVYDRPPDKSNVFQRFIKACRNFKGECKKYVQEFRNEYHIFPVDMVPDEDDILWKFDGTQKSLDQWIVNSDKDYYHGFSVAKLELSPSGSGIFHGVLDTRVPKDGRTAYSGYCNITTVRKRKSFNREDFYDWHKYNEIVLRIRGDGRCYMLNILQRGYWDIWWNDAFNYVMYTRGGPYWQIVRVPFSKFLYSQKGEVHENQHPMPDDRTTHFGITIADKKPGPFRLEIDYIAVNYNPNLFETFAYEQYEVPR